MSTATPVATKIHPLRNRAGIVTEWITQYRNEVKGLGSGSCEYTHLTKHMNPLKHANPSEGKIRGKSTVKSTSKSTSKKKGPRTHFIHAGLAQIDFEAEFAKVVKNPLGGSPH